MRRFAWVWLAGCLAWTFNFAVSLRYHNTQRAELALVLAVLFGVAYAFYRS